LITAQVAIGFVKSSKTIPYLEKGCDPKFWRRIHWSYVGDSGDELALTLSQRSILGLSWTEDAKAEKILKRLEARPYHERQTASIKEAIERFDDIRALGMEEYQSMAGTLRPRGVSPLKPMAPETPEHQEK
jgi:hypothetical protein